MSHRWIALIGLSLATPLPAHAAEVEFEGWYRARMRLYDGLSLDADLAQAEGVAWYAEHRLWLRPRFLVNDQARVIVEIRGLDGVRFGDGVVVHTDPVSGDDIPTELQDDLAAPTSSSDETAPLLDFTLWRAWAEADTPLGAFAFGRMPVHWGAGVWQNDGLGPTADGGDTADRVQWTRPFDDIYVELYAEANVEGFVNQTDDTTSIGASAAYRTERVTAGLQTQWRRTPIRELNLFTVDAAADARIGTIDVRAEAIGRFGSGGLTAGANDVTLASGGGVVELGFVGDGFSVGVDGGLATGDAETEDTRLKTFEFDPDYNVGIILFEQPMPVLSATNPTETNDGRSLETVLLGDRVSNAMWFQPRISKGIIDGLAVEASLLTARTAKVPERLENRKGYGLEIDGTLRWTGTENVDLAATFGTFIPGGYFKEYDDDTFNGFDETVYAVQIVGQVRF